MATAVPKHSLWVCSAINAPGRKGSCMVSGDHRALKPIVSAVRAMDGIADKPVGGRVASNIILSSSDMPSPTGSLPPGLRDGCAHNCARHPLPDQCVLQGHH